MMASAALRLYLARPPSPLLSTLQRIPFPLFLPSHTLSPPLSSSHRLLSSSPLTPIPPPPPPLHHLLHDPQDDDEGEVQSDPDNTESAVTAALPSFPSPNLTVREKKELASYAHSLGKALKCQQVGKSGVTPSVAAAFVENLESNELLKLKVHGSCPGELSDVIRQLEESTGSVAVDQIGRSVILYRPSLSKMKKKEAQSARKNWNPKRTESPATTFPMQKKGNQVRGSIRSAMP